jgi:hypothetical protein
MIEKVELVSDGIIIIFTNGTIKYCPATTLGGLGVSDGCIDLLPHDESELPDPQDGCCIH